MFEIVLTYYYSLVLVQYCYFLPATGIGPIGAKLLITRNIDRTSMPFSATETTHLGGQSETLFRHSGPIGQ